MPKSASLVIAMTIALTCCIACGGTGTKTAFVGTAAAAATAGGTSSAGTPVSSSSGSSAPSASPSVAGAPTSSVAPGTLAATGSAALTVTPTTTLALETANNTSGANSFAASGNGNAAPGNVSQENIHKLLYAGSTAKIYAHYIGWWGSSSHINNGYDAATLTQAHKQISDMMNRGIDGLIIDWYGAGNTHINQASLYIKQDAETRGGKFTFAIMEDQGAVRTCAYTAGCDVTQAVINDFNYINSTYASSPAYIRINGQPVIFTFDTENLPNIDWTRVLANIQGNPKIVLRNDQGFRISYTSGSYAWVAINKANQGDWGQSYLDDFYTTSRSYASELVYPGVWKGFNDTVASWSENRIMSQNCGQTWLTTINEMNKYYSTSNQPQAVQLVTWNDYEEGTEIETGIDNCVSVSGSVTGTTLYWSISGQENTVDHYSVFISQDGQNLMKLTDVAAGTHQLDLSNYGLAAANYTLYVKAIGQPSMLNKMSGPIPFTPVAPAIPFVITPKMPLNAATVGQSVHFVATSSSPSPVITMRIYVDNVSNYLVNAGSIDTTLRLTPGPHYVVLQGWNQQGQISKTPLNIIVVNQPPVASLVVTPSSGLGPLTVAATAAGSDADGTVASTSINFGDGTVMNGTTGSHTYSASGTYTVTATVTDNDGAKATAASTVSVTGAGVTLTRPARGSLQSSPVAITASAVAATPIVAMRVYVDNVSRYSLNSFGMSGATLNTALSMSPGAHYIVVQAWDAKGNVYKSSTTITVR